MILPSKELIEAVMNWKNIVIHDELDGEYDPCLNIEYETKDEECEFISGILLLNIYELMHLMKEWAYTFGYEIKSYKRIGDFKTKGLYTCMAHDGVRREWDAETLTETEPETVFNACEWILKEKASQ